MMEKYDIDVARVSPHIKGYKSLTAVRCTMYTVVSEKVKRDGCLTVSGTKIFSSSYRLVSFARIYDSTSVSTRVNTLHL